MQQSDKKRAAIARELQHAEERKKIADAKKKMEIAKLREREVTKLEDYKRNKEFLEEKALIQKHKKWEEKEKALETAESKKKRMLSRLQDFIKKKSEYKFEHVIENKERIIYGLEHQRSKIADSVKNAEEKSIRLM